MVARFFSLRQEAAGVKSPIDFYFFGAPLKYSNRVVWALLFSLCLALSAHAEDAAPQNTETKTYRYSIGLGYPDLRARAQVWGPLMAKLKYTVGEGGQP